MKILMVGHYFPQRAETFILEQANSLVELGHDVSILVLVDGDPSAFDERSRRNGLPERVIDASPMRRAIGGRLGTTLRGALKSLIRHPRALLPVPGDSMVVRGQLAAAVDLIGDLGAFDVIHAFFGPAGVSAMRLRDIGLIDGPIVTSFLGYDVTREIRLKGPRYYARLFRDGAEFNPNSDHLRRLLLASGAPEDRTHVHRLGIDLELFPYAERTRGEDSVPVIAAVGRLVEKKGFEFLLRAAALMRDRGVAFRIELAGDGPLMENLSGLVGELRLEDQVTLLGWTVQSEIAALLKRADLFAVPSVVAEDGDQEGLPLTLLEACGSGLPIVATRHSGIPEAVEEGVSGLIVEERDVEGLSEALERLCEDEAMRGEFGRNARQLVETRFSASIQGRKLEQILMNAAGMAHNL